MNILDIKTFEELQEIILKKVNDNRVNCKHQFLDYCAMHASYKNTVYLIVETIIELNIIPIYKEALHIIDLISDYKDFLETKRLLNNYYSIDVYLKHKNEFENICKTLKNKRDESYNEFN